jgi:hypothetical protein
LLGELEEASDGSERVIAQPVAVRDEDEKEVEQRLWGLEALEVAVAEEAVVKPAKGCRHLAPTVGTEDVLLDHAGDGSAGASGGRSSLVSRRRR